MQRLVIIVFGLALAACSGSPPPKPPEPVTDARRANELAMEAFEAGRYAEAAGSFSRAERLFRSLDDAYGIATAALSQAEIHLLLGDRDASRKAMSRARDAAAHAGNDYLLERVALLDARLQRKSNAPAARRQLRTLLQASAGVAMQARLVLCEMAIEAGNSDCAGELASDDILINARIEQLHAQAAMQADELDAAETHLARALSSYRSLAHRPGMAAVHSTLATVAERQQNAEQAQHHLQRALYLQLWMRARSQSADLLGELARLATEESERKRYLQRQQALLAGDAEPEWETLLREVATGNE